MTTLATPVTLRNDVVRLEPLTHQHADDLCEATADGDLHTLWFTLVPSPTEMTTEIDRRLTLQREASMNPFAVISLLPGNTYGKAVGMTTFMHIDQSNQRVEIGSTWYRAAVQRTPLNSACKRLLLGHAFDTLACIAVEFRTHVMNHRSRRAIERVGAKLDGVLRSHQINRHPLAGNSLRDTCVYSLTQAEWPAVRAHLDSGLSLAIPQPANIG